MPKLVSGDISTAPCEAAHMSNAVALASLLLLLSCNYEAVSNTILQAGMLSVWTKKMHHTHGTHESVQTWSHTAGEFAVTTTVTS